MSNNNEMSIYEILGEPGLTNEKLKKLSLYISTRYNIKLEEIKTDNGILQYYNNSNEIPIINIPKNQIQFTTKNEDTTFDSLDISNLKNIKTMSSEEALKHSRDIINSMGPWNNLLECRLETSNDTFSMAFKAGYTTEEYNISTKVIARFSINKIPVEGPGVKFIIIFNNEKPISIYMALSTYTQSKESIHIIDSMESKQKFMRNVELDEYRLYSKLVYLAPSYSSKNNIYPIKKILPSYIVGGEFLIDDKIIKFTQRYISATNNYQYVGVIKNLNINTNEKDDGTISINVSCQIISNTPLKCITGTCNNITDSILFYREDNTTIPINKSEFSYIDNKVIWSLNVSIDKFNNNLINDVFISMSAIDILGNELTSSLEKICVVFNQDIINKITILSSDFIKKNNINTLNYDQTVYCSGGNADLFFINNNIVDIDTHFKNTNVTSIGCCVPYIVSNFTMAKWATIIEKTGIICGFMGCFHNENQFNLEFVNYQKDKNIRKSWCLSNDVNQPSGSSVCIMGLCGVNSCIKTDILLNYNEYLNGNGTMITELIKQNICGYWIYKSYN
jgi:hypothetical protein